MTASAHTTAMQAPTERNPDYRRQEWREAEVIAQIDLDGGLTRAWIDADRYRPCAVDRLVRAGRIRLRLPAIEGNGVLRYEVVKPERARIHWPSFWNGFWYGLNPLNSLKFTRAAFRRLHVWLGGAS